MPIHCTASGKILLAAMKPLAVPVTGPDGAVIAAVACHAPSVRFNVAQAKAHLPLLKDAARKLSATLAR